MIKTTLRDEILRKLCPACRQAVEDDVRTLDKYNRDHCELLKQATERLRKARARFARLRAGIRSLSQAVAALDPAAADDQPYSAWDAAKWKVFNAAVKLVKEDELAALVREEGR